MDTLCIDTVKFPLFYFFKRQNSVKKYDSFSVNRKRIGTPIRKVVLYKETAFLLP